VFPWKRYGDKIDMRSLADYRVDVVERAELACGIAGQQGIGCVFFSALGMDLWRRGEPDPGAALRARASSGGRMRPPGCLPPQLGVGAGPARVLHRGGGHAAACLGKRRQLAAGKGVIPRIPPWENRRGRRKKWEEEYKERWSVERTFACVENFRRLVVRYKRMAKMYEASCIAALLLTCLWSF